MRDVKEERRKQVKNREGERDTLTGRDRAIKKDRQRQNRDKWVNR